MTAILLGTSTNADLTGVSFDKSNSATAIALLTNRIKNDQINGFPIYPGAFSNSGLLYVPNRGILKVFDGDAVAVDTVTGWPILVSAAAIAAGGSKWVVT